MNFELPEEYRALHELVRRFVADRLIPLEPAVLAREAAGEGSALTEEERAPLDELTKSLGLWGLDAPEEMGGAGLPHLALVGVNEALGGTVAHYTLPPDSPNLRMLMAAASPTQRETHLRPYAEGKTISAIAISEPGAGADPAGMRTRAVRDGNDWVIDGRKIWITRAAECDFAIVMAITDAQKRARGGMSAFLVDRGTPGFQVLRRIPMLGGEYTYEVVFENCRVPVGALLGREGDGFGPMQLRLGTRRMEMAAWCIGAAQRALDMMREYAPQRSTFGARLSERQTVQNWVADAATQIHAARLMAYDCAWKLDQGRDVRSEISMIKYFSTEMAQRVIDNAMQCFGAMGMTKEMPLHLLAARVRNMRIYDGPSEIHRWVVARNLMDTGR